MAIRFGTDGWRGIIGEDYTFDNVRACAQGTAEYLGQQGIASQGLLVGYDTRFASEHFAAAVAEVSAANGVRTLLCRGPAPTPVISYNVVHRNLAGAVIITASHNPARWNGFKYKPEYGGSASSEVVAALEENIAKVLAANSVKRMPLEDAVKGGMVERIDPRPPYMEQVRSLVDLVAIKKAGLEIVVDAMFGAGAGYIPEFLSGGSTRVVQINGRRNPLFPGIAQPEPVAHNLHRLSSAVVRQRADIGIALDGDADRVGIVDERGRFITPLEAFALLCLYLLDTRGEKGPLVRSLTMTSMIDRLGEIYGVPALNTPVGFKYLGPVMRRETALAAGEESGGYAFRGHIPERDGIISGLFFLDMMVRTGKTPSELVEYLFSKVGPHHYDRWDLSFDMSRRHDIEQRVERARPLSLAGKRVTEIDTRDGYRFVLEGGYWALIRFSGTEPLLRIYAEAESPDQVQGLLEDVRALAGL